MEFSPSEDVQPITALRHNAAGILRRARDIGRPVLITQRGTSAAILEDVTRCERRLERLRLLESIVEGLQAVQRGETAEHEEGMKRLEAIVAS